MAPQAKFSPGEVVCHLWASWNCDDGGKFVPMEVGGKKQAYKRAEWYRGVIATDACLKQGFWYAGKEYFDTWCYIVH